MSNDAVMDKIRKLLRAAEEGRGTSENEMRQAIEAAHRLAAKHNLDIASIDAQKDGPPPEPIIHEEFRPTRGGDGKECQSRFPYSHKYIVWLLCGYFGVRIIESSEWGEYQDRLGQPVRGWRKKLTIFGRQSNVAIALYLYGFFHEEFTRGWVRWRRKNPQGSVSDRNSYFWGMYCGLNAQLRISDEAIREEYDQQTLTSNTSSALVLVKEGEKIDAEVKKVHPRLSYKKTDTGSRHNYDAINDGRVDGEKVKIRKGLK